MSITPEFRNFIIDILKKCQMSDESISDFTTDEFMVEYFTAFYHGSLEYKIFKYTGEPIVKDCVSIYIINRKKDIVNIGILTKLFISIEKQKLLATVIEKLGILKFIIFNEEDLLHIENNRDIPYDKNNYLKNIVERIVHSFIGCLNMISNKTRQFGVGHQLCYNFIAYLLDTLDESNFNASEQNITDFYTRLKELFDNAMIYDKNLAGKKINIKDFTEESVNIETKIYTIKIYYPWMGIKVLIGTSSLSDKNLAKQKASEQGITWLLRRNFRENVKDVQRGNIVRGRKF